MKRIITILLWVTATVIPSAAQVNYEGDELNMEKYWYLRKRLVEKFVKVGAGFGEGHPADIIIIDASDDDWIYRAVKRLEWGGDATAVLGWYIGVLSTELKLLRENGEDYSGTTRELYYALNALNRLDDYAELVWDYSPSATCSEEEIESLWPNAPQVQWDSNNKTWLPQPGGSITGVQRNGFFIRADGPPDQDFRDYFTDADVINSGVTRVCNPATNLPVGWSDPTVISYRTAGYWGNNEESQDQLYHILMGLSLTAEFVDSSVTFNGVSLNLMARDIGIRFIENVINEQMSIVNPVMDRLPCNGGGFTGWFTPSLISLHDYLDNGVKNQANIQLPLPGTSDVSRNICAVIMATANTCSNNVLCGYVSSDGFDWKLYYLLREAIYSDSSDGSCYSNLDIRNDLGLCPCRGPHWDGWQYVDDGSYLVGGQMQTYGTDYNNPQAKPIKWYYPNWYTHSGVSESTSWKGEFNGLDYMLLFNLATIVRGEDAIEIPYTDMLHHYFHPSHGPFGGLWSPYTYTPVGFLTLTTDVKIPAGTRVETRAGHSIDLLPGFDSQSGYFTAEITDTIWTCENNTFKNSGIASLPPRMRLQNLQSSNTTISESTVDDSASSIHLWDESNLTSGMFYLGIYPNPATDKIYLQCSDDASYSLTLLDAGGRTVVNQTVQCGQPILLSGLEPGYYTVCVEWNRKESGIVGKEFFRLIKSN